MGSTSDKHSTNTKQGHSVASSTGAETDDSYSMSGFASRHIGVGGPEVQRMLDALGENSLDSLIEKVVPESIRDLSRPDVADEISEHHALQELARMGAANTINRSMIGQGYYDLSLIHI